MKVYLPNRSEESPPFTMYMAPAADADFVKRSSAPSEWWVADPETGAPKARQIEAVFHGGVADVPDALGRYVIERGLAFTTPRG